MPCDYKLYPADWHEVSRQIRFERAKSRCERCNAENYQPHPVTSSRVVLTVAHQCDCEPLCADLAHLLALCQKCHNNLDSPKRQRNASRTRRARKNNREMFEIE